MPIHRRVCERRCDHRDMSAARSKVQSLSHAPKGARAWWLADKVARRLGASVTFSQEGEDRLLERMLQGLPPGTYVDVGAHDPVRFSNTMGLHLRGWRGVCIDPRPGAAERFHRVRPGDVFIGEGVGNGGTATYFEFDEPALNTYDEATARDLVSAGRYRMVARSVRRLRRLDEILAQVLPEGRLDLISVDVEGRDLEVLMSNDWERFRPAIVCCEARSESESVAITHYMGVLGFTLTASSMNSRFFTRGGTRQDSP